MNTCTVIIGARLVVSAFLLVTCVMYAQCHGITDDEHLQRIRQNVLPLQSGLGFAIVNPQGDFRDALQSVGGSNVGYGLHFHVGYRFTNSPVWLIGTFAPVFVGGTYVVLPFDGGLFSSREITSQTMVIPVTVAVRVQPNVAQVLYPYAEVLGGITGTTATATYRESRMNRSNERRETRLDATWNYGLGVGLALNVADMVSLPNSLQRFTLDASMRYLRGGALDIVRGVVDATSTEFVWQRTLNSNLVQLTIGLTVQF